MNCSMIKKKKINLKYLHIAIIVLGIIFVSLSIFHTNMWFDESYSVAITRHSFAEIWQMGSKDVHPILYYFCLHALYLIFGENLIVYRMFSALMISLLGVIGYTHIRKDFGEKTGLLFSFFALFLPIASQHAGELRMYSLGMLLGTIMTIYAYRIYKGEIKKTTYLFFGLSSIAVAYTHYYGLMLAGIVNLLLFIFLIKNRKDRKNDLIKFIITAVIQVVLYIPWLICFLMQLKYVSEGFWISLSFPGTIYEILTMQCRGNLPFQPIILTTIFYSYIVYLMFQTKKEERKPATWCFAIYIAIILIALIVSLCMQSVILLDRYLLIITGMLIFAVAYFMAKDTKKWRIITVCIIVLIMSGYTNIINIKEAYGQENKELITYLDSQIKDDDIIIYSNVLNGAIVTTEISQNHENMSYFYNINDWNVKEQYKVFNPYMETKDTLEEILDNYSGRIWIVEGGNTHDLLNEVSEKYTINKLDDRQFSNKYKDYQYTLELVEKL